MFESADVHGLRRPGIHETCGIISADELACKLICKV